MGGKVTGIPPLNGLVLNGGKSERMGTPKGDLHYHNKNQKEIVRELLGHFCLEIYLSVPYSYASQPENFPIIIDEASGLGPLGGILSAFKKKSDSAWLTIACDLPFLDKETIGQLIGSREPSMVATCFFNPETESPEPLVTIWEPKAYPILIDYKARGELSPKKVLRNSEVKMIDVADPIKLRNVNTPEERKAAKEFFESGRND